MRNGRRTLTGYSAEYFYDANRFMEIYNHYKRMQEYYSTGSIVEHIITKKENPFENKNNFKIKQ